MKKIKNEEKIRKRNLNFRIQSLSHTSNSKFQTQNSEFHSGITLVALVVTIVVLLILAGITIGTLVNKDIINLAKKAGDKTNSEVDKTLSDIEELRKELAESFDVKNTEGGTGENPETPEEIKITGINFVPNTAEVKVGANITLTPNIEPADATNKTLKWTSLNTDIATINENGVVTPIKTGTATITAEATDGSEKSATCTVTVKNATVADIVGKPADTTNNITAEDKNGNPITIPAGFTVLPNGEDGVIYKTDSTNHSPCVEDGIVVQDSTGNQFVWVPVNDSQYTRMIDETNKKGNLYTTNTQYGVTSIISLSTTSGNREPDIVTTYDNTASNFTNAGIYNKTEGDVTNATTFKALLQKEFNEMAASAKKYKGFYIGRYETGNLEAVKDSIPVVQRGNKQIAGVNWYYQYANIKNIAKNNDNATSSMIWGCQWDRTIEWIISTNNLSLAENISSWGNYSTTTFKYKAEDGTTKEKAENTNTIVPTGSTERNKKNNIYDMAGNYEDWTLEAFSVNNRPTRRGQFCRQWSCCSCFCT